MLVRDRYTNKPSKNPKNVNTLRTHFNFFILFYYHVIKCSIIKSLEYMRKSRRTKTTELMDNQKISNINTTTVDYYLDNSNFMKPFHESFSMFL